MNASSKTQLAGTKRLGFAGNVKEVTLSLAERFKTAGLPLHHDLVYLGEFSDKIQFDLDWWMSMGNAVVIPDCVDDFFNIEADASSQCRQVFKRKPGRLQNLKSSLKDVFRRDVIS